MNPLPTASVGISLELASKAEAIGAMLVGTKHREFATAAGAVQLAVLTLDAKNVALDTSAAFDRHSAGADRKMVSLRRDKSLHAKIARDIFTLSKRTNKRCTLVTLIRLALSEFEPAATLTRADACFGSKDESFAPLEVFVTVRDGRATGVFLDSATAELAAPGAVAPAVVVPR